MTDTQDTEHARPAGAVSPDLLARLYAEQMAEEAEISARDLAELEAAAAAGGGAGGQGT